MWQWNKDAFGTLAADENPESLGAFRYNLRFPGQLFDGQAGLHQNWRRDYSPAVGQYVESDPIGLGGGMNTFVYVGDNPISYTDASGLARANPSLPPAFYLKACDGDDWKECEGRCSPNRVLTCKRRYDRRLAGAKGGNPIYNYVKGDVQCNCDDKTFCERNPKTCTAGKVLLGLGIVVGICLAPEASPMLAPAL